MTGLGWEFWGLKFSMVMMTLVSACGFLYVWLKTHGVDHMMQVRHMHCDAMAGDEGED